MKRGSSGAAFLQLLSRIRATIPGVALRTSFIVGFPGETDADFIELCDFVKAAEFDWMGVFPYSDVDNASSFCLDEKVDEETIKDRQSRLMQIQQKISARKLRRFRGARVTALVEGPSKDSSLVWEARLEGMAPEIDGKLYLNDIEIEGAGISACPGDIVTAEITETHEYDMVGHVVEILDLPRPSKVQVSEIAPVQRVATGAALRILV
jgi:ribosomal protein S12 methylthiotransferase